MKTEANEEQEVWNCYWKLNGKDNHNLNNSVVINNRYKDTPYAQYVSSIKNDIVTYLSPVNENAEKIAPVLSSLSDLTDQFLYQ